MTTWAHIVGYAAFPGDARYEVRACVYCGAIVGADMKPINMDSPPHHTPFNQSEFYASGLLLCLSDKRGSG